MKTLKNSLRKTTLSVFMILFSIVSLAQQDSKVWLTIENENHVPYISTSGNLVSNDIEFNAVIGSLIITNVQKALSSSRNELLQKVYEVSCNCDVVDLYTVLSNDVNSVSKVEYGPQYQTLATIVDYNGCVVIAEQVIEEMATASAIEIEQNHLNIYPNPTSDYATISWDNNEITKLSILNANGQIVDSKEVSFQKSYQTKNLKSGLYIIILTDLNYDTYTGKLIAE